MCVDEVGRGGWMLGSLAKTDVRISASDIHIGMYQRSGHKIKG